MRRLLRLYKLFLRTMLKASSSMSDFVYDPYGNRYMLEVIAFGFQGVVVLVFNLPPAAPGGHYLHDVGLLHRVRGSKRIVVHHLTIQGGGRELTPVHSQCVV